MNTTIRAAMQGYAGAGFCPIPVAGKRPIPKDWTSPATPEILQQWAAGHTAASGVGILTGTPAGHGFVTIAVDIDATDTDAIRDIESTLPPSPMVKRGAKGKTLFYRAPVELAQSRACQPFLDILGVGRQTVMPPSRHPSGCEYEWIQGGGIVRPEDLPKLTEDHIVELEEMLASLGWDRRVKAAPHSANNDNDAPKMSIKWMNAQALQNLPGWVEDLPFDYSDNREQRGGWRGSAYRAVDHLREGGSGNASRKNNLSFSPLGIRDFGTDATYSALDIVARGMGCDIDAAYAWLGERVADDWSLYHGAAADAAIAALAARHNEKREQVQVAQTAAQANTLRDQLVTGNFQPRLSSNYLVKSWLGAGALSMLFGPSNVGKTFVGLDIAVAVAMGTDWWGHKVRQGTVVYVAAEGGGGIVNRLAALQRERPEFEGAPFHLLPRALDLFTGNDAKALVEATADLKPALIVVDTLARSMGSGDENTAKDSGQFIANCDTIREATGAHVMVVHHSGKDTEKGARGSSALRAAVDTEIAISEGEILCAKQRDMEFPSVKYFTLKSVFLGYDEDGEDVFSAVVEDGQGVAPNNTKGLTSSEWKIVRWIADNGAKTTQEVMEEFTLTSANARKKLRKARDYGAISSNDEGRVTTWFADPSFVTTCN